MCYQVAPVCAQRRTAELTLPHTDVVAGRWSLATPRHGEEPAILCQQVSPSPSHPRNLTGISPPPSAHRSSLRGIQRMRATDPADRQHPVLYCQHPILYCQHPVLYYTLLYCARCVLYGLNMRWRLRLPCYGVPQTTTEYYRVLRGTTEYARPNTRSDQVIRRS